MVGVSVGVDLVAVVVDAVGCVDVVVPFVVVGCYFKLDVGVVVA